MRALGSGCVRASGIARAPGCVRTTGSVRASGCVRASGGVRASGIARASSRGRLFAFLLKVGTGVPGTTFMMGAGEPFDAAQAAAPVRMPVDKLVAALAWDDIRIPHAEVLAACQAYTAASDAQLAWCIPAMAALAMGSERGSGRALTDQQLAAARAHLARVAAASDAAEDTLFATLGQTPSLDDAAKERLAKLRKRRALDRLVEQVERRSMLAGYEGIHLAYPADAQAGEWLDCGRALCGLTWQAPAAQRVALSQALDATVDQRRAAWEAAAPAFDRMVDQKHRGQRDLLQSGEDPYAYRTNERASLDAAAFAPVWKAELAALEKVAAAVAPAVARRVIDSVPIRGFGRSVWPVWSGRMPALSELRVEGGAELSQVCAVVLAEPTLTPERRARLQERIALLLKEEAQFELDRIHKACQRAEPGIAAEPAARAAALNRVADEEAAVVQAMVKHALDALAELRTDTNLEWLQADGALPQLAAGQDLTAIQVQTGVELPDPAEAAAPRHVDDLARRDGEMARGMVPTLPPAHELRALAAQLHLAPSLQPAAQQVLADLAAAWAERVEPAAEAAASISRFVSTNNVGPNRTLADLAAKLAELRTTRKAAVVAAEAELAKAASSLAALAAQGDPGRDWVQVWLAAERRDMAVLGNRLLGFSLPVPAAANPYRAALWFCGTAAERAQVLRVMAVRAAEEAELERQLLTDSVDSLAQQEAARLKVLGAKGGAAGPAFDEPAAALALNARCKAANQRVVTAAVAQLAEDVGQRLAAACALAGYPALLAADGRRVDALLQVELAGPEVAAQAQAVCAAQLAAWMRAAGERLKLVEASVPRAPQPWDDAANNPETRVVAVAQVALAPALRDQVALACMQMADALPADVVARSPVLCRAWCIQQVKEDTHDDRGK